MCFVSQSVCWSTFCGCNSPFRPAPLYNKDVPSVWFVAGASYFDMPCLSTCLQAEKDTRR
jgi:hypothetical protein